MSSYNQYKPGGFKMLPPVIKNLLIINALAFLAYISVMQVFRIDLNDILGMHYLGAEKFNPYQILTYMFMHGSIGHLFFNMFALWMFGNNLENYWGPKKFLIYYFVTGIGAGFIHYIVVYIELTPILSAIDVFLANPTLEDFKIFMESDNFKVVSYDIQNNYNQFINTYNSLIGPNPNKALQEAIHFMNDYRVDYMNAPVVVGASGAVFGLLLAFGMMWPNSVIYLYFAIPIKTKYFVILYGALELYSGFSSAQGDNVAHFAHLGGMIFGFILIKLWKKKENNQWM